MTLRNTIADAFASSRLTERELAKATGLNARTVHRILTEDGLFIDALTLRHIAEALRLDYYTLLPLRPEFPENPMLTYVEPYASSASELVTEVSTSLTSPLIRAIMSPFRSSEKNPKGSSTTFL